MKNNDWYAVDWITDFTTHMFNSLYEGEDSHEDMVQVFNTAVWDASTPAQFFILANYCNGVISKVTGNWRMETKVDIPNMEKVDTASVR